MNLNNRHLIVIVLLLISTIYVNAQTHYSAVVQHRDNVSAFYGDSALIKANDAAVSGDTIYLSEGNFKGATLTKAVVIYGAGNNTVIASLVLNVTDLGPEIYIEGITVPQSWKEAASLHLNHTPDVTFNRCSFYNIDAPYNPTCRITFLNCSVNSLSPKANTATFIVENSKINTFTTNSQNIAFIKNSDINLTESGASAFSNCIIKDKTDSSNTSEVTYSNCVLGFTPFDSNLQHDCSILTSSEIDALFKENTTNELTDQAAAAYKGDDGTQVGMYGGSHPFTLIPSTPVITHAVHPSAPTADGKLPLEITVEVRD